MSITQTVEIPASHRLTVNVPSEIPAGPVVLTFTSTADWFENGGECPLCAIYKEPNEETLAAFAEGDAIEQGEILAKWYTSLDEMWEDLHK